MRGLYLSKQKNRLEKRAYAQAGRMNFAACLDRCRRPEAVAKQPAELARQTHSSSSDARSQAISVTKMLAPFAAPEEQQHPQCRDRTIP
jgi:hypothetical protein